MRTKYFENIQFFSAFTESITHFKSLHFTKTVLVPIPLLNLIWIQFLEFARSVYCVQVMPNCCVVKLRRSMVGFIKFNLFFVCRRFLSFTWCIPMFQTGDIFFKKSFKLQKTRGNTKITGLFFSHFSFFYIILKPLVWLQIKCLANFKPYWNKDI